jgi:DNA-directed RNA polymerase specialized sigma24 family protein
MMRPSKRRGIGNVKTSFEALSDRVAERLLLYLARRVRDPDAAAELWAECWAVAFENWPRGRASGPAEAEAWMFGIVRNQLAAYAAHGSDQAKSAREA